MSDNSAPHAEEPPTKKRRKVILTLDKKVDIIHRLENGETAASVGRAYNINESSVRTIRKNSDKILNSVASSNNINAKVCQRVRHPVLEKMEELLVFWLQGQNEQSIALTSTVIREKATELYQSLQENDPSATPFLASKGWFKNFSKRSKLRYVEMSDDERTDDSPAVKRTYVIENGVDDDQLTTGEAAKTKWRSLRDYYRHEQKRVESSSNYVSSWNHFDQMTFLKDSHSRNPRQRQENDGQVDPEEYHLPVEPVVKLEYEGDDDPISSSTEYPEDFKSNVPSYDGDLSNELVVAVHNNKKRSGSNDVLQNFERRKFLALEKLVADNDDDDLQFFKSLIPDVKGLPRARKAHLRLKIQQLVCQEVYGESTTNGVKEDTVS